MLDDDFSVVDEDKKWGVLWGNLMICWNVVGDMVVCISWDGNVFFFGMDCSDFEEGELFVVYFDWVNIFLGEVEYLYMLDGKWLESMVGFMNDEVDYVVVSCECWDVV